MNANNNFDLSTFDVKKFDEILSRGLSKGLGNSDGSMCIEAAICNVLGMEHNDDPKCVAISVRSFKILLNDKNWSSPEARAKGLRSLGIAQLGSLGVIDDLEFTKRLASQTIKTIIPKLFRQIFPNNEKCLNAVVKCENEGTSDAAYAAADAADAAAAADAAYNAADAAYNAADAAYAAADAAVYNAVYAVYATANDEYLILSADIALQILKDMGSPGCSLL